MKHLDERRILEIRDGLPVDADHRAHLEGCPECAAALLEAESRSQAIDTALRSLDEPIETARAKEAVRARLAAAAAGSTEQPAVRALGGPRVSTRPARFALGKAAAILLVAAGAASALPGSPIREWIVGPTGGPSPAVESLAAPEQAGEPAMVGGTLPVRGGAVSVSLSDVPVGTGLTVRWIAGGQLTIRAAAGSAFSYGEAEVRAEIAGGPVVLEIPATAASVILTVNGRTYLSGSTEEPDVLGPVSGRGDGEISFTVGG